MLTWLDLMRKDSDFVFPGQSGNYRVNLAGKLQREPAWAEFRLGRPMPLAAPSPTGPLTLAGGALPALAPKESPGAESR